MKEIYAAFVKSQKEFGPALKTSKNPFFNSKYADLGTCVEAVIDALHANEIALVQHLHECQSGVTVETVFIHASGESMTCGKLHVPAAKQDPQGYGSAITYARRYSLMAACGIAPEDDDGNAAQKKPTFENPKPTQKITPSAGAFDALPAEEKTSIQDLAIELIDLGKKGKLQEAANLWMAQNMDADQQVAVFELLATESGFRNALKKKLGLDK